VTAVKKSKAVPKTWRPSREECARGFLLMVKVCMVLFLEVDSLDEISMITPTFVPSFVCCTQGYSKSEVHWSWYSLNRKFMIPSKPRGQMSDFAYGRCHSFDPPTPHP